MTTSGRRDGQLSCLVRAGLVVRAVLASRYGVLKVAAAYGPFIWVVMSRAVIPIFVPPPPIGFRWWVQFIGHFPFVGIPIVASSARCLRPERRPAASA